jgi:hypothetical protein
MTPTTEVGGGGKTAAGPTKLTNTCITLHSKALRISHTRADFFRGSSAVFLVLFMPTTLRTFRKRGTPAHFPQTRHTLRVFRKRGAAQSAINQLQLAAVRYVGGANIRSLGRPPRSPASVRREPTISLSTPSSCSMHPRRTNLMSISLNSPI